MSPQSEQEVYAEIFAMLLGQMLRGKPLQGLVVHPDERQACMDQDQMRPPSEDERASNSWLWTTDDMLVMPDAGTAATFFLDGGVQLVPVWFHPGVPRGAGAFVCGRWPSLDAWVAAHPPGGGAIS